MKVANVRQSAGRGLPRPPEGLVAHQGPLLERVDVVLMASVEEISSRSI